MDWSYINIDEVRDQMGETGSDSDWLDIVKEATEMVEAEVGFFYPEIEARRLDGEGDNVLFLPDGDLLSVTSIVDDTDTLTSSDYLLYPRKRRWRNGPYTRIEIDPDATTITAWSNELDIIVITGAWGLLDESEAITGAPTVATEQSASSTSLVIATGSSVKVGMLLLIDSELEFVTAVSTGDPNDTYTVIRDVLGTTGAIHSGAAAITRQIVPASVRSLTRHVAGRLWKSRKSGYTGKTVNIDLGTVEVNELIPKAMLKPIRKRYPEFLDLVAV